ncbi:lipase maturation factor 2 isoform X1 [Hydra vulgaris]|uniref:lipase maturation factor 2 isoform X1 n=2 Tax=Hydra vulgaris TaxID=6087 RepID=UPI001F5F0EB0|nr:lipase maturation factor 2 isoform X1 [Hydra vulgaris]
MSLNKHERMVHALFQWCISGIYLFAFLSLYFQVRGLYGPDGLLPAHLQLKSDATLLEKFKAKFTLLWLAPYLKLNVACAIELYCIMGGLLSAGVIIFERFRNRLSFFVLWLMYFSIYQVGQTFMWFQWDILLLETGFLTIFLSQNLQNSTNEYGSHHNLIFWLVKWLLFRLMFASGIVKLTSMCPAWWSLTALNWHYESQCIPTALAWYAHQLPEFFQKLSVVVTFVIEIPIPFLFFSPLRSLRLFAFYSQIIFQVTIILTGNYNFFNALTIVLCITLLDDEYIDKIAPRFLRYPESFAKLQKTSRIVSIISSLLSFFIIYSLIYFTKNLFNLKLKNGEINSEIVFTKEKFLKFVEVTTKIGIGIGIVCFMLQVIKCFYRSISTERTLIKKLFSTIKSTFFVFVSTWLFCISLVPFTDLDRGIQDDLWPIIQKWHSDSEYYHIANSYGLFRSMTGVGGRPELVIEGSDYYYKEWKELPFYYKPGNLSAPLGFVAPHQPRLDWQMWFAALGSYQRNPWFVHLIYKILQGSKDVAYLMAPSPFKNNPPKYVRSSLYTYHYTKLRNMSEFFIQSRKIKKWWRREYSKEYTPPLSKDDPSLIKYIHDMGWNSKNKVDDEMAEGTLFVILNFLYQHSRDISPTAFILHSYLISVLTCFIKHFLTF